MRNMNDERQKNKGRKSDENDEREMNHERDAEKTKKTLIRKTYLIPVGHDHTHNKRQ